MKAIFSFFLLLMAFASFAQTQTSLEPDQNPNYLQSQNRYMMMKDSLIASENTTPQQTYKAYDWYQAKLDNRAARRETRREIRLANAYNYNNYYSPYNYGYNNFGYNNFGFNNFGYNNWWSMRPLIGYRSGNWNFCY